MQFYSSGGGFGASKCCIGRRQKIILNILLQQYAYFTITLWCHPTYVPT